MTRMFDATKPPEKLLDTAELLRQLAIVRGDEKLFQTLLGGWVNDQNRNQKIFSTPLANDSFATLLGLQLNEALTLEEFQDLLTTISSQPYGRKLKIIDGVRAIGTLFDVNGFSTEALEAIPELKEYDVRLHLAGQVRIDKKQIIEPMIP